MKKFLSVALASAMALSMASVAFAAKEPEHEVFLDRVADDEYIIVVDDDVVIDPDVIKDFKISYDFTEGGEFVDGVNFEVDKFDGVNDSFYKIVIDYDTKEEKSDVDFIGTITLKAKSDYIFVDYEDDDEDFVGSYDNEVTFDVAFTEEVNPVNNTELINNKKKLYNFEDGPLADDEEAEIEIFPGELGTFTVDTRGQKNLWIKADVKYSQGIENVSPDLAYTYYNTNNPSFNKMGTLVLHANETDLLYKVNADKSLTKMDVKYDADEEGFVIRTRVIGSYVIAEKELPAEALTANVPASEAPAAPAAPANPSTGAAC